MGRRPDDAAVAAFLAFGGKTAARGGIACAWKGTGRIDAADPRKVIEIEVSLEDFSPFCRIKHGRGRDIRMGQAQIMSELVGDDIFQINGAVFATDIVGANRVGATQFVDLHVDIVDFSRLR